ncbi:MAG: hypothetical protein ACR2PL_04935 [Dehalococcoidia bacterium]
MNYGPNAQTGSPQPPSGGSLRNDEQLRQDLHATLGARQQLGPNYEQELIDSFLTRLDQSINVRLRQRLPAQPLRSAGPYNPTGAIAASLALSIPLIAIAGGIAHLPGILAIVVLIGFLNVYYDRQRR